jgi:hypothetical protein
MIFNQEPKPAGEEPALLSGGFGTGSTDLFFGKGTARAIRMGGL